DVLAAAVALAGSDVPDGAVAVLEVVPGDEALHPLFRRGDPVERHARISRRVLQRSEESLGVWVVVRDVRAAERGDDAQPLQGGDHGAGTHGLAVVRVQHETSWVYVPFSASLSDQFRCDLC